MNNVLSAELYKLRYNVTFYICLIIAVVVSIVGSFTDPADTAAVSMFSIAGNLSLFLAIIISSLACDDYEKNTMKNLISSGNSRWHIYGGKLLTALIIGVIFFFVDGLAATLAGFYNNGVGHGITALAVMESLVVQLLLTSVYVLTFFGFASIIKSSKFGLLLGIVYVLFASMVPWALGNYVLHTDLSAFSLDTLSRNIEALKFSTHMIVNFAIYGGFAVLLNILGFLRFKREEI